MEDKFNKEKRLQEEIDKDQDIELIKSVIKAKMELDLANKNFENADGDLIDYYIYQIKANQYKLNYLLKKIKNKQLVLDMVNEIKFRLFEENAM